MENRNRQVVLKQRPTGAPTRADFTIADAPLPDPAEGEVLVRGIYLSLDPYMRGRISGVRCYAQPVAIGAVMEGRVVGAVVCSAIPPFGRATMFSAAMAGSSTARAPDSASSSSTRR